MEWLNYHHLYYFWMVSQAGSISAAARELHLARPTVTAQLRELEKSVGKKLYQQQGRELVITEFGMQIIRYAEEIFAIGHELKEFVKTGESGSRARFRVGIPDVVPKLIAFELLRPALQLKQRARIICREGKLEHLLADLAIHKLDLVLSDSPAPSSLDVSVYSHLLGECRLVMMAAPALAKKYRPGYPKSLNDAPLLLPTEQTAIRRSLDRWLDEHEIFPEVVAEFEDSALLKVFGQAGEGVFPVPAAIEQKVIRQYGVEPIGTIDHLLDKFYVISVEKRIQHEAALAIIRQARSHLFDVPARS